MTSKAWMNILNRSVIQRSRWRKQNAGSIRRFPRSTVDHLNLEITPKDPRNYVRTMYELIYLAFRTDSTRVATYQIGRENGVGISDHLAKAVGFTLAHSLSHETKEPDGWKRFGIYCRFLNEEYGRFVRKLKETPGTGWRGDHVG